MAGTSDAQALLLTISADTTKVTKSLDALNKRLSGIGPEMERHGRKAAEGLESGLGSFNPGKALDRIFDRSRLAVIEEGGAKIGVFGSAIEELGPAGLVAAAGVAALGVALEEARKAVEFADSLYKAAQAAHVSTDALQEYRAAIVKAGGDANAAGPALLAFSETLGKAQEGLKGLRPFQALFGKGFSVADVRGLGGNENALDAVVAKIQNLSSRSQQDAAISQFGLQGLAPLILAGADAWKEYRDEAKKAGLVLDQDVIRRSHELNVQMDELSGKIKNELTDAFIAVGPTLVGLLGMLAKALDFLKDINILRESQSALTANGGVRFGGDILNADGSVSGALDVARSAFARSDHGVSEGITEAQLQAGLGLPKGKAKLADLSNKGSDQTASLDKLALDALNAGREAVTKANAALVLEIKAHAEAEKDAVDTGLTKKLADLEADAVRIAAAKNDANKAVQLAEIKSAQAAQREAAAAEKALIDRQTEAKLRAQNIDLQRSATDALVATLRYQEAAAVTASDRNALAGRILARQQDLEQRELNLELDPSTFTGSASDAAQKRADLATKQQAARDQLTLDQQGPLDKYLRGIQDLNTAFQTDGVEAIHSLIYDLEEAALHAKNLGDVVKSVLLRLALQATSQFAEKEAAPGLAQAGAALLHFLPGFASGTSSAPGGLALVGERGPELVNLPKGSAVTPTFQTLQALSAMKAPRAAGVTVIQPFHFHAEGAVVSQDILDQANATAAQFAAQAGRAARAAAVGDVQRGAYLGGVNQ